MAEKVVSGQIGESNAHTRVATIELSTKVIDDEERLRSTLLHEMCHAAQWLVSLFYYFREVFIDDCLGSLAASLSVAYLPKYCYISP
jgi:hypothetical protein